MKLIVVLSLEACADDLMPVYRGLGIPVFSETDIRGFYLHPPAVAPNNWFGSTDAPAYSKLTFAFVEDEQAGRLLDAIRAHNETHGRPHPVRAFTLNVEQSV
jgi:hypothetical protein